MRAFGLQPDEVIARTPAAELKSPPAMAAAIAYGAVTFCAVSALAYSVWAFGLIQNTALLYSTIALIYVGVGGLVLSRLVVGRGATVRFAGLFAVAFAAFAVAWCAAWFGLKGKYHADLWGAVFGLAAMSRLIQAGFAHSPFLPSFAVLFFFYTSGYYLGDSLHTAIPGSTGRLLWGVAHGLGFGAGLGYLLHASQATLVERTRSRRRTEPAFSEPA